MAEGKDINEIGNEQIARLLSEMLKTLKDIDSGIKQGGGDGGAKPTGGPSMDPRAAQRAAGNVPQDPERMGGRPTPGNLVTAAGNMAEGFGDFLQNRKPRDVSTPPNSFQKAGQFLQKAGSEFMPEGRLNAQAISHAAQTVGRVSTNLNYAGESQGLSGAGGDISIGGIGFRTPFSAAGQMGMRMKMETIGQSFGAGITGAQATNIQNQLIERGHQFDTANYGKMRDAMTNLTKENSALGQDPLSYDILDKSTRLGGSSIEEFNKIMKEVPDVMGAAQESMKQVLSDMDQMGDYAKKTGGTYAQGAAASQQMGLLTGLAGPTSLAMQENGFVKANAMTQTGLLPWQMGQMTGVQRTKAMYSSMDQLYNQMGPAPKDKMTVDAAGFKHVQSGQQQRDADVAMMMGTTPEVVAKMRRDKAKVMAKTNAEEGFTGYTEQASAISKDFNLTEEEKKAKLAKLSSVGGKGTYGELEKQMKAAGFSGGEMKSVMEAGKDKAGGSAEDLAKQAAERKKKFEEIVGKKTGKDSEQKDGSVVVTLSEDAKRYLSIVGSPSGEAKTSAGAGQGTVVSGQMNPAAPYQPS